MLNPGVNAERISFLRIAGTHTNTHTDQRVRPPSERKT